MRGCGSFHGSSYGWLEFSHTTEDKRCEGDIQSVLRSFIALLVPANIKLLKELLPFTVETTCRVWFPNATVWPQHVNCFCACTLYRLLNSYHQYIDQHRFTKSFFCGWNPGIGFAKWRVCVGHGKLSSYADICCTTVQKGRFYHCSQLSRRLSMATVLLSYKSLALSLEVPLLMPVATCQSSEPVWILDWTASVWISGIFKCLFTERQNSQGACGQKQYDCKHPGVVFMSDVVKRYRHSDLNECLHWQLQLQL